MADLALILADAADTAENRSMLIWATWATEQGIDLAVVAWFPGPLLERFAEVAPTLDASTVNRWRPARGLARLRLTPLSRFLKGRRLRAMLAPIGEAPAVLLSGRRAFEALAWLPSRERRVVAQLWTSDLPLPSEVQAELAGCAAVAVSSDAVAHAVAGLGPTPLHRSGLVVGPAPIRPEGAPSRPGVAVVGIADDCTEDLLEAARAIRMARVDERVLWVRRDPDERWSWSLFGDPRVADLAGRVERIAPEDVAAAEVVLVAGAGDPTPAIQAARAGVPVLAVIAAGSPVGEYLTDLATAAERLGALMDGDDRTASAEQVDGAERHAVERMGAELLALVRGA